MKTNKLPIIIEHLFYLLFILYFVGKTFEVITALIDLLFIIYVVKNQKLAIAFFQEYKKVFLSFSILLSYFCIQPLLVEMSFVNLKTSVGTIRFVILFFAAIFIFDTNQKIKKAIITSFIGIGIVSIDSIYQYLTGFDLIGKKAYGGGQRLTAWNDMPKVNIMMGEFFGLLLCATIIFKKNLKYIAIIILITATLVFMLSGNRSPLLALFSSVIFILFFSHYKKHILGLILIFSIFFIYALNTDKMSKSLSVFFKPVTTESTNSRLPIYLTGMEILKNNILFGIGPGQFSSNFKTYQKETIKNTNLGIKHWEGEPPMHIHHSWLDILVSYGIIGFIFYILVFYSIYIKFVHNSLVGSIAALGTLYCITPLQFSRSFTQSEWQFITYLSLIFLIIVVKYNGKMNNENFNH